MAGLFSLSTNSDKHNGDFLNKLFLGMFYLQHLGNRGGFAYFEDKEIRKQKFKGAIVPNYIGSFDETDSCLGIAYYGNADEPFYFESILENIAICFCGNISNINDLRGEILRDGGIFERKSDIEIIAEFIVRWGRKKGTTQRQKIINGIKAFNEKAIGAYSMLILTKERMFAVHGPDGRWPLIIGKSKERDKAIVIASETAGFSNLEFEISRELKPGEVVSIKNGRAKKEFVLPEKEAKICDFLWAYTASPTSQFRGMSAANARKKLGACLAFRDIEKGFFPHLVIPIPDSGFFHWLGYVHEFLRQARLGKIDVRQIPLFDELLVRYTSVRSFLQVDREGRDRAAYYKMLTVDDYLNYLIQWLKASGDWEFLKKIYSEQECLIVVLVEDSVVRGTQLKENFGPKLRRVFAPFRVKIYVRSSYPSIVSHCIHGQTTKKDEILAVNTPDKKARIRKLKIDGLEYNTRKDFVRAVGLPCGQICMDCTFPAE